MTLEGSKLEYLEHTSFVAFWGTRDMKRSNLGILGKAFFQQKLSYFPLGFDESEASSFKKVIKNQKLRTFDTT